MAEDTATSKGGGDEKTLYTLTEVSNKTSISMPTLQRYKKNYQDRIPSVGKGRKQRYPEEALEVFKQIKKENVKRRGRPPKNASARGGATRGRPAEKAATRGKSKEGLLTLTKVAQETGISYPTLVRYVKNHGDRIPHEGTGRTRRYYPEAIEVFQQLRSESPRGRRRKKPAARKAAAAPQAPAAVETSEAGLAHRVHSLESAQANLERQIKELIKQLKKPLKVTINR
jgi:DNA-binding transcriptional MerR regulator